MRPVGQTVFEHVTEIDKVIGGETRVKRHPVKLRQARNFLLQVDDKLGPLGSRIVAERKNLSPLLGDK